jgi:hypothetical protein
MSPQPCLVIDPRAGADHNLSEQTPSGLKTGKTSPDSSGSDGAHGCSGGGHNKAGQQQD